MEIKLLQYTNNPIKIVYTAARTCYSEETILENWEKDIDESKMIKLLDKVFESGHHSVFEHISFTFGISGISRTCSHQLVRHRLASYSQQSQRYVILGNDYYIIPPSIEKNEELKKKYIEFMSSSYDFYKYLLYYVEAEDARFILPNATKTNIVMTMNFRELYNTCAIRLCQRAQWEIRELFYLIKKEVAKISNYLADKLVARCESLGYCPEEKSCGKFPSLKDK